MSQFLLTQEARSDLKHIARFTQKRWGRAKRNQYLKSMDDVFHLLAEQPSLGATCDDVLPGYRRFPQGSHVVFYQVASAGDVLIVRILHRSMDVQEHLK